MIVPCIDVQGGRVVQLVQGERVAVAEDDLDAVIDRFAGFPLLHAIDLDAAKGEGQNRELIRRVLRRHGGGVRVGGGIRDVPMAREWIDSGADSVIVGSAALQSAEHPSEVPVRSFLEPLRDAVGRDGIVVAVDCRGARIATHGWRATLDLNPADVVPHLEPYASRLLVTHVDREGTMQGIDREFFLRVSTAASVPIIAAGGVGYADDVRTLLTLGCDVAVGMAIYSGRLSLDELRALSSD